MKAAVVVANEDVRYQVIPGYVKVKVNASGILFHSYICNIQMK